ncbi:ABC transporter, transmembrane region domain protein, partial [Candidatus Magnetoovum chiemensis]
MVMSRVLNDVALMEGIFSEVIRAVIIEVPKVLILLSVAFYRKWDLTLASLALVPMLAYSAKNLGRKIKERNLQVQNSLSFLSHKLSESFMGIKVIKVFNRENYRDDACKKENQQVYHFSLKAIKSKETTKFLIDIMTGIA